MGILDRVCDGTCPTSVALGKLNEDLRGQLVDATRTLLALVDAKAYRQRYPVDRPQPVVEAEKESDVYLPAMSYEEVQRAAEEAEKLDRLLLVKK